MQLNVLHVCLELINVSLHCDVARILQRSAQHEVSGDRRMSGDFAGKIRAQQRIEVELGKMGQVKIAARGIEGKDFGVEIVISAASHARAVLLENQIAEIHLLALKLEIRR